MNTICIVNTKAERARKITLHLCVLLSLTLWVGLCLAQSAAAPANSAPLLTKEQMEKGDYTTKQLAQRPYSALLPKPLFPSSPREQKQFSVQYLYDYAESVYIPAVEMPIVSRAAAVRDSPEAAIIGFFSALRTGDNEWSLSGWDPASRQEIEDNNKLTGHDAAYWRGVWHTMFDQKRVIMAKRIETLAYVIIDVRVEDRNNPSKGRNYPNVLKNLKGSWVLTSELNTSPLLMSLLTHKTSTSESVNLEPARILKGGATVLGEAQEQFLERHADTTIVRKAAQ